MFLIIRIILFIFIAGAVAAFAQVETASGQPRVEEFPQSLKETMAKQRIADEKKDHDELLERSELTVKLSTEIETSYLKNKKLTSQDKTKLKELEKLVKKLRSDLGGESDSVDDESQEKPSLANALGLLRVNCESLYSEIKKTSRHAISAVAIGSSNALLSIVKFLRLGK